MFGMMPGWGAAGPVASGLLLHFDGNLTDSSPSNTVVTVNAGTVAYTASPAKFGSSVYWNSAGYLSTGTITGLNKVGGFLMEGWAYFTGGGNEASIFEIRSGGVTQVGLRVNPSNNNMRVIYNVAANYTDGIPAKDAWHHFVLATWFDGLNYRTRSAVDGVWGQSDISNDVVTTDMSILFAQNPGGEPTRHYYDEFRLTLGAGNFPYTPGTNFTPPTAPFTE